MERQAGTPDTPREEVHDPLANAPQPAPAAGFPWYWAACAALTIVCAVAVFIVFWKQPPANGLADPPEGNNPNPKPLFVGWDKPATAIVVSGQVHGYLQPCGCSEPQYGGLVRRYNLIESLKAKGWPVTAVDVGDIPQKGGPQTQVKYKYSMQALKMLDVAAVGVGKNELSFPLLDVLAVHTLNDPEPAVLAANLMNEKTQPVIVQTLQDAVVVQRPGAPKVGVLGLIGPSVSKSIKDQNLNFPESNAKFLKDFLEKMQKEKVQVTVLLYQGSQTEAEALAKFCKQSYPNLPNLDLIVHISEFSEPPANPVQVAGTNTSLVTTGHKGRYVGVVGVYPSQQPGRPFELKYQLVHVGPEFNTPPNKEATHPLMKLMEEYALDVKNDDYVSKFPVNMHEVQVKFNKAEYVGSKECQQCHDGEYNVWAKSEHSHAFAALVNAKNPSNRQFDGECVSCHVTGFEHVTGYGDALRAKNDVRIKMLQEVGCESCHGPGSEHINATKNKQIHEAMNPWHLRPNPKLAMDTFCQKCHDIDNDVHWNFEKRWADIVHKKKNRGQPVNAPAGNGGVNAPGVQAIPVNPVSGASAISPKKDE